MIPIRTLLLVIIVLLMVGGGAYGHNRLGVVVWSPLVAFVLVLVMLFFLGILRF